MFIKSITIKNFKGFKEEQTIEFNYPDGTNSGLNFFVGENNTGKSTVFEAIDFLFNGLSKGQEIENLKNKNHLGEDIIVKLEMIGNLKKTLEPKYHTYIIENDEVQILKLCRSSENKTITQGKKQVDMDVKKLGVWNATANQYENVSGFDKAFLANFDIDFIRADTSPDDIAKFGSATICGKLINRISESFKNEQLYKDLEEAHKKAFNEGDESLKAKLAGISKKAENIFKNQFGDVSMNFYFDNMDISSYFKNTKIQVNDGTETFLEDKGSGMQRVIALTLLQVYIDLLAEDRETQKPFYFFIDEPELCLHPSAQIKLAQAFGVLGQTQQIFLTTHSPYIFQENHQIRNVFICKKNENIIITPTNNLCLFGQYSPTWGEINYIAYNLPTIEFHNELYGYIQAKAILEDEKYYNPKEFDNYLVSKGLTKDQKYRHLKLDQSVVEYDTTLSTKIRNIIHHPENTNNDPLNEQELKNSIAQIISLIQGEDL